MTRQSIEDRAVALGDGQWNNPALRFLLENVAAPHTVMEGYEIEREFPGIGRRSMLLNAREVVNQRNVGKLILLIEDVTERRAPNGRWRSFYGRRNYCCRKCTIAWQTACRSSRASFSKLERCNRRIRGCTLGTRISGHVGRGSPTTAAGRKPRRSGLHRPLSLSIVPDPGSLDDGRQSSDLIEVQADGGTVSPAEALSVGHCHRARINAFKHAFVGDAAAGALVIASHQ